jgi:endoglucanase
MMMKAAAVAGMLAITMILAGPVVAQTPAAVLDDTFDGKNLDEAVWMKGGSNNPLQTVREGSLRLVSTGMMNQAFVATKRDDLNFFKQPLTVVWDLVSNKTLAGPYAATRFSKAYGGLQIGATSVKKDARGGAELGLTAWPGEVAAQGLDAPWFYTLNLGRLMPSDPTKNYGEAWLNDWKLSGLPQRMIWTLGPTDWSVEIRGARFVNGDPQKRSGKHGLKEADFSEFGFHLLVFASAHVSSMEPGANFVGAAVYTDRIGVSPGTAVPAYAEGGYKDVPVSPTVLQDLLGKDFSRGAWPSKPQYLFGVNYAGGTFRKEQGFVVPDEKSLDYWKSKGVMLMRLPFDWERVQPKLQQPLDAGYVANLKRTVTMMGERGMKVLLDMHNYDRYNSQLIGADSVPLAAYGDAWKRLAGEFKDNPAIWGYGIMNEPYGTNGTWPKAAQAGIDGIRAVDAKTMIVVAGDNFSGTENWARNGAELPKQLHDPSNNLCWEGHCYFDNNSSGKYNFAYEYELNRPNASIDPMIGVKRIEPFVKWLKANNYKGILGEFGVPANLDRDPRWLIVLDNVYEYLRKNGIPNTFWAAGTLWTPGRGYVIEPDWRDGPNQGRDRSQMQILLKHARAFAGPGASTARPASRLVLPEKSHP